MSEMEELRELGVNVEEGLKRLNGNEALYTKLLGTLVKTIREYYVAPDFDGEDLKEAAERAHAIKGVTGNLSVTPLYDAYTEIVRLLRGGEAERAREALREVLPKQEAILGCIEKHMR